MMFDEIIDEGCVETARPSREKALGFIDDVIVFQKEKVLTKGEYNVFGCALRGFEIHHGVSVKHPLWYERDHIKGTFVHGLFEDEAFENYKKRTIDSFIDIMRSEIDMERIMDHVV